jgi:Leucine-rich repeat (LRR) protein
MNLSVFKKEDKWENFSGNINIYKDLVESDIENLIHEQNIHSIQFYTFKNPSETTWETLNKFYGKYPAIGLTIFWYDTVDFAFLSKIPNCRNFGVNSYLTKDFKPIETLSQLTKLHLGETKSIAVDIDFIKTFKNLEVLNIDGMKKGVENIKYLTKLYSLNLRGVKLKNLNWINSLEKLKLLKLMFGSYQSLQSLAELKNLEYLGISRVRQIENYDFLKALSNLKFLHFEGLATMEAIPSFQGLENLKKLQIENLAKLKDIKEIAILKNLEELLFYFPENFKAADRELLSDKLFKVSIQLPNLKMTNLLNWTEHTNFKYLNERGVKVYEHSKSAYRQNVEGGWVL